MLEPKDRARLDLAHKEKLYDLRMLILSIVALVVVIAISNRVTAVWEAALCYLGLVVAILLIATGAFRFIAGLMLIYELNLTDQDNDEYFYEDLREYIDKQNGA